MYQYRDFGMNGGGTMVSPRGFVAFAPPAPLQPSRGLVVDLGQDVLSARWWRGAATLALLCGALGLLAPKFDPLPAPNEAVGPSVAREYRDAGVAPLRLGGRSGGRMAAGPLVDPLLVAPERTSIDLDLRLGGNDRIDRALIRLGALPADAVRVAILLHQAAPKGVEDGTAVAVRLGQRQSAGLRGVERIALRSAIDADLVIANGPAGLTATRTAIAVDQRPRRISGRVGDGLYWSLRSAGVSSEAASDYLKALSTRLDVGADLSPSDRFDLVIAHRRAATGEERSGPLLYAGIRRLGAAPIELLKWTVGGRTGWFDAGSLSEVSSSSLMWPVNAPITSEFGMRYHPILHFSRMHKGMDFGARWGTPIVASADGVVNRAGWAGGYGQQVRIAHAGGIGTSYSHMSRMVVSPGMTVRQGQLIGYVGTTGLSTGPHLHYETYRDGVAVNPRSVRFTSAPVVDAGALSAFRARMKALLASARG